MKVAHPLMLRAIALATKKNGRIDAGKIADRLRCDFLPKCHMASTEIRDRRRGLRYRNLLVRQMVQMKNRVSGLHPALAETQPGDYPTVPENGDYALVSSLHRDPVLAERIQRLRTVPGVGPITALTWALEIGDVSRFRTMKQAISYCGLCGAEKSSADKVMRTPLSKQPINISSKCDRSSEAGPRRNTTNC
ncbi:MAG: transposase [Acidobacteriota bacterium]